MSGIEISAIASGTAIAGDIDGTDVTIGRIAPDDAGPSLSGMWLLRVTTREDGTSTRVVLRTEAVADILRKLKADRELAQYVT